VLILRLIGSLDCSFPLLFSFPFYVGRGVRGWINIISIELIAPVAYLGS
jgi:TM2 domain-containing membrane protein YozV